MSVSHGKLCCKAKSPRRAGWSSMLQWFEVKGWWEEPKPPLLAESLLKQTPGSPSTFDATCQLTKPHLKHLLISQHLYPAVPQNLPKSHYHSTAGISKQIKIYVLGPANLIYQLFHGHFVPFFSMWSIPWCISRNLETEVKYPINDSVLHHCLVIASY